MAHRRKRALTVHDSDNDEPTTSSTSSTPAPETDSSSAPPVAKKLRKESEVERFNARYKVGIVSNEDILGESSSFSDCICYSLFVAEAQMENWSAPCYTHFQLPPNIIVDSNGVVKYQFVCLRCVIFPSFYSQTNMLYSDVLASNLLEDAPKFPPVISRTMPIPARPP